MFPHKISAKRTVILLQVSGYLFLLINRIYIASCTPNFRKIVEIK